MVVCINICKQEIAILNYDKGIENIEIKLIPMYTNALSVLLNKFLIALEKAEAILKKCAEEDKTRNSI